jgi:phosphatidylinositol-3-phosphatase
MKSRLLGLAGATLAAAGLARTGQVPASAAGPTHPVVIVFMENHGLAQVLADPADMPYLNSLWKDPASEQFTSYFAVTHPSFPNYAALATGIGDVAPDDTVKPGQFADRTLWEQLASAGVSWGVYEESMPVTCSAATYADDTTDGTDGPYKIGHNPAVPFAGVYATSLCQNVQPLSAMNLTSLPAVSFVAPNLCDDMHGVPSTDTHGYANCVTGTPANMQRADAWLSSHVQAWTAAGADVFVTFDEGSGNGNQVYAALTGPGVTPGQISTQMSHYSLLAGIEDAYGLPLLGAAGTAAPVTFPGVTPPPPPPPPATSCPVPGSGHAELSQNVSVESAQTGWTGVYTSNSKVTLIQPAGGSYDGVWALQVSNTGKTAAATGVNNAAPVWVSNASTAGAAYTATGEVRGIAGEEVNLMLRETTPAGAGVSYHTTTMTLPDSGWHSLTSAYTAKAGGDTVKYSLWATRCRLAGRSRPTAWS